MSRRNPSHARRRGRGSAGETLVETLATVTILGIAMVAIMAGIGTALRLSGSQRRSASAAIVLGLGAEAVKGATPSTCSGLTIASYRSALDTISPTAAFPVGWTSAANLTITSAVCDNASALKLQTITVKATATCPSACPSETVDILKRSS